MSEVIKLMMHKKNVALLFLLLASIVFLIRGYYVFELQTYKAHLIDDAAYYYNVAWELKNNGSLKHSIVEPATDPLNSHIGIIFVYYMLLNFTEDPIRIFQFLTFLSFLVFIASMYVLFKIGRELKYEFVLISAVILFLTIGPHYFRYVTYGGKTEAYFYFLVLLWVLLFFKWVKQDHILLLVGLFIGSVLLYAFRLQALILFAAAFGVLILNKNYIKSGIIAIFSIASVYFVLFLNRVFGGVQLGKGELGHASNTLTLSWERIWFHISHLPDLFFNVDDQSIFVILIFSILTVIMILFFFWCLIHDKSTEHHFIALVTFGSLIALFLFRTELSTVTYRYIYYVIPLFALQLGSYVFKSDSKIVFKSVFGVYLFLLLYSIQFFPNDPHTNSRISDNRVEQILYMGQMHNLIQHLTSNYQPEIIYTDFDNQAFHRMHFVSSRTPIHLITRDTPIQKNALVYATSSFESDANSLQLVGSLYLFRRLDIYYFGE